MFLRYEYVDYRGFLLKIIKFPFTHELVHKARFLTGYTASLYYISQCLFVCMLPFFSATAEPFALKLGMVF